MSRAGTSAPELAIGIEAVRSGDGAVLLTLELSALARLLALSMRSPRLDRPVMIAAAACFWVMAVDGVPLRTDGLVLPGQAVFGLRGGGPLQVFREPAWPQAWASRSA